MVTADIVAQLRPLHPRHCSSPTFPLRTFHQFLLALFLSAYSFGACLGGDTSQLLWPPGTGHTELAIVAPVLGPPGWEKGSALSRPPDD